MTDAARPVLQPRPLLVLATGFACVLVGVLALEYHSAVIREMRLPLSPSSVASARIPVSDARSTEAVTPDPVRVQDWTQTALARPLFSPSRRPPTTTVAGPQRPRLTGIVVGPVGRWAIFAGAGDDRGIVAAVGQQAGAWRVVGIDVGSVRVLGPEGPRTLHPSRDDSSRSGSGAGGPVMPEHPSILDLLRSRPLQLGMPGMNMPVLPAAPQPPAAPQ
jgi:hypothetical protein